jgi:histidine triad (HIT) family protein
MDENCVFCRIIAGKAPAKIVYQDDRVTAFWDIHPAAPCHILIVPNLHLDSMNDVQVEHEAMLGQMLRVARQVAEAEKVATSGYRLIINTGRDGGQVVQHVHMHLLGGQHMRYPIG